ncbi:Host attachment protein [Sphingobium baderi LL03]|uniref:Host attachment protein n=2 Tax=Sphingobium baderi TaxID=1332080 RepID=T0GEK8_9SPHN|nr:hypothetical protein L485_09230 [Sphingobium baderi LL03]KMS58991.1 Host attachment protein [Sphingobium baderi LL03]
MILKAGTIVLVTDGAKMLLLKNKGDAAFPDLAVIASRTLDNPPNREQMSDAPGLSFSSMGHRRSTYGEPDPHQQAENLFAANSAAALAQAARENESELVVVAPPATLSILRQHYARETQERLAAEIAKDLTGHSVPHITKILSAWESAN